jgi:N-acetylglutamate synthase-like GNAT family acetyltransferase
MELSNDPPTGHEFLALRASANMPSRSLDSAIKGISNTFFWVTMRDEGKLIGMGRLIGDGGTAVIISDFVVHPDYQARGVGKEIMRAIQGYISKEVPSEAFVGLFATKEAVKFYESFGFLLMAPDYLGMLWPCKGRKTD